MVNAFCAAVIMFLVSMTQDARLHNIIFWLMGDLSSADGRTVALILAAVLLPCFGAVFLFSHAMNLLLMGNEMALSMGLPLRSVTVVLLVVTSLMVSAVVSSAGSSGSSAWSSRTCCGLSGGRTTGSWSRPASWGGGLPDALRRPGADLAGPGRDAGWRHHRPDRRPALHFSFEENPAMRRPSKPTAEPRVRRPPVLETGEPCDRGRRFFRHHRSQRLRQDHALEADRGILTPAPGRVRIFGRDIRSYSHRARAHRRLRSPGARGELPLHGQEAVLLGRAPHQGLLGIPRAADLEAARRAMAFTGVDALAERTSTS
jgi:hypothetical protein